MKTVGICDTQPIAVEGLRSLLQGRADLSLTGAPETLGAAAAWAFRTAPAVLLVDKAFGLQPILDWIISSRAALSNTSLAIWGNTISEAETLRFLQHGVRGIIRKDAKLASLLTCLKTVAEGSSYMEETLFKNSRDEYGHRSDLTPREQQVLALVEQGLKNREIAHELGIRPGTVKIHLKHVFEKTGVRGRYGLALSVLRDKGLLAAAPTRPQITAFG